MNRYFAYIDGHIFAGMNLLRHGKKGIECSATMADKIKKLPNLGLRKAYIKRHLAS